MNMSLSHDTYRGLIHYYMKDQVNELTFKNKNINTNLSCHVLDNDE